jgi:hypothetical protein
MTMLSWSNKKKKNGALIMMITSFFKVISIIMELHQLFWCVESQPIGGVLDENKEQELNNINRNHDTIF